MWCEWEVRLVNKSSRESPSPETPCFFLLLILVSFLLWKYIRKGFPELEGQQAMWSFSQQFVSAIAKGQGENNWPLRVSSHFLSNMQPFLTTTFQRKNPSRDKEVRCLPSSVFRPHHKGKLRAGHASSPISRHLRRAAPAFSLLVAKALVEGSWDSLHQFLFRLWAGCHFCLWSFLWLGDIVISWWLVLLLILISLNISSSSFWKFMLVSGICLVLCEHLENSFNFFFFLPLLAVNFSCHCSALLFLMYLKMPYLFQPLI